MPEPTTGAVALPPPAAAAVIPRATYRLQLHKDFDFSAAQAVLPYLQRLGISHVYCSPISCARPGSLHGYDVIDHARINPELGGEVAFAAFAAAARSLGLGLLLDQVPNHMGVLGSGRGDGNAWWQDVMKNGQASEFADHFDIDWQPPNPALQGRVLVPVLGEHYGEALESGDLHLAFEAASSTFVFRYHTHHFPLDPRSTAGVLGQAAAEPAGNVAQAAARDTLQQLAAEFASLPPHDTGHAALKATRRAALPGLQQRFREAVAADAEVALRIARAVEALNAEAGLDVLDALHEAQAYRLACWRIAGDEINYRRFFDINDLAATRVEDERVFEATQGLALDLAARGVVDGLRIDHPDGLLDPAAFFRRLQQRYAARLGSTWSPDENGAGAALPLYVVVEKIVALHERVPTDWAVHGTTGYRFATLANGLFVERRNALRMERIWRNFSGVTDDYARTVYESKRTIASGALASQLTLLAQALQHIALADRRTRDHGFNALRDALAEVAAAMPVYRTYVTGPASAQDRRFIDWAIAQARQRSALADASLFDFVRDCLLVEPAPSARPQQARAPDTARTEAMRQFAMRFQQFCAPVAAKGVEDTAFYRYHRLVSLNEVGGDPAVFGISAAAFHRASAYRAAQWPHTMLATSTHDNKRAEDVRNRIDVVSERPGAWRLALRRWKTATRSWLTEVDGEPTPSPADQYLLHQTLLGTLPAEGLTADTLPGYRERIEAYAVKAAREAKLHTRWAHPNAAYEAALQGFVRKLLDRLDANPVLTDVQTRATEIAGFGALNSLALSVLKFTSPGVPDVYQGCELMDLSLVDPDNRRPVDYASRQHLLAEMEALAEVGKLRGEIERRLRTPTDGWLKLCVIWRLLALRRAEPALFESGDYTALRVVGAQRRHVIAFARRSPQGTLLVLVGRKFAGLPEAGSGQPPVGAAVWGDTAFKLPPWLHGMADGTADATINVRNALTGDALALTGDASPVAPLFAVLPFAVFHFSSRCNKSSVA